MEEKQIISRGQLLLTLLVCRAFTLMTFVPLIFEEASFTTRLAAAAISTAVQAVLVIPIVLLNRSGLSVTELAMSRSKAFGIIAAALYLLFFLFHTANSLLHFQSFLSARFFKGADSILWILVILAICVYCGCLGIEALGRSSVLLFWIFIAAFGVMLIYSAKEFDPVNIRYDKNFGNGLFAAVMDDLARNGEICALAFLSKHVKEKFRCGVYGLLAAKLVLVEAVMVTITAVLGEFARLTDYPFLTLGTFGGARFIQRGDSLYLVVWTITAVINSALFLHIAGGLIGEILPKIKFRTSIAAALVFVLLLIFTLSGASFNGVYSLLCSGYSVAFLTGVIPLIVLLTAKKGGKKA